jgi:hypothetical protein
MHKTYMIIILLLNVLLFQLSVQAQNVSIAIKNSSFESLDSNSHPINWKADNPASVQIDGQHARSGSSSLKIHHPNEQSTIVISEPIEMKIGHLYKLSAWVKTEAAFSNPMDRYPTSVPACITMSSFPFTNHSPAVGATNDWQKIEVQFIASTKSDQVRLHFGYNGSARGTVWFDEIAVEKVEDITEYIAPETVRWFDEGYRYDDRGWIFVHVEGDPYTRGYQYGHLIAEEMVEYMNKLSVLVNESDPKQGWRNFRFIADAFMLRKYETEYLTEMRGIADGANKAGLKLFDRELDLIDVVTMNSAIDIRLAQYAMPRTANPLSGQNFLKSEDELNIPEELHKCSSFLANNSSTTDGRIVFGQIFMWRGYTGPHWNVICDLVPTTGNRLVYQTFPGGIHSGADFYINDKGIMIGETTVSQTPFNPDGSPQSNRIRKAAQYAENIDDVVEILTTENNGLYTNDWLIGDTKTDEIAVLLLGTYKHKLWRSSNNEFYGDTNDFYWCNNNNKDPEVRKEYIANSDNAPYDLIFTPWNRDIAFNKFYREMKGKIDAIAGVNVWASSPINRPHACDGKVTTSDMAENLVFLAHAGKVTLREKFIGENRRIPDLPGATPRLSLGYSVASPIFITEKLKELRKKTHAALNDHKITGDFDSIQGKYEFDNRKLWYNTVYPKSESENWFVSATAAYWRILKNVPEDEKDAAEYFYTKFAELTSRYLYTTEKEGSIAPEKARRIYDNYNHYQVPRIKGTFLLHQLRLSMGNDKFSQLMNTVHDSYREKEMSSADFIKIVNRIAGNDMSSFINQWLKSTDIPELNIQSDLKQNGDTWQINLTVNQPNKPFHFYTSLKIDSETKSKFEVIEVSGKQFDISFTCTEKPQRLTFNALRDVLLHYDDYYTWANYFDDFHRAKIVYGTKRQIEANHTLALRFNTTLADRYTEELKPVVKDGEMTPEDMSEYDLIVIGSPEENSFMQQLVKILDLRVKKNMFTWLEKDYTRSDQGFFAAFPNPYNPERAVYLYSANSALQLYHMTHDRYSMPSWAIFENDKVVDKGYHQDDTYIVDFDKKRDLVTK